MSTLKGRIVCALSGGVDSAAAAALLQKDGWDVVGVTLRLQKCENAHASRSCCGVDGVTRARALCELLGIRHYLLDCTKEFESQVLQPAWEDYSLGRTPSPCLFCNERIKFGHLLSWAKGLGIDHVATGHYARIVPGGDGRPQLRRGADESKDQSYFLAGLTIEQLSATLFPLGDMTKPQVRALASQLFLPSAETPESQDACLVDEGETFAEMLRLRFKAKPRPGVIRDESGAVVARHNGVHLYTRGQRRGIPVQSTSRTYIKTIDGETGEIVITQSEAALACRRMKVGALHWLLETPPADGFRCLVQVRYRSEPVTCDLKVVGEGKIEATFLQPVRAVTPGQAAVFYDGDRVLGRGWIDAAD